MVAFLHLKILYVYSFFYSSTAVATLTILSILSFQLNAALLPQQVFFDTFKTHALQNELVTVWC